METSRNHGPAIEKFWPATSYGPERYKNREPYCAAAVSHWVRERLKIPAVQQAPSKTAEQLERGRCKSARAFDWIDWAKERGVQRLSDSLPSPRETSQMMVPPK